MKRPGPRDLSPGTDLVLSAWRATGGDGLDRLKAAVARCSANGIPDKYAALLAQAEAVLAAPADPAGLGKLDDILRQAVSGAPPANAARTETPKAWWFE